MYNITVFITRIVWAVYVELSNCENLVGVTQSQIPPPTSK